MEFIFIQKLPELEIVNLISKAFEVDSIKIYNIENGNENSLINFFVVYLEGEISTQLSVYIDEKVLFERNIRENDDMIFAKKMQKLGHYDILVDDGTSWPDFYLLLYANGNERKVHINEIRDNYYVLEFYNN